MRLRLLDLVVRIVVSWPRRALAASLVLGLASAVLLPGLQVKAGHSSVVGSDTPQQKRFMAFLRRFGSPNVLFALVEGGSEVQRRRVVDGLLERLPQRQDGAAAAGCAGAAAANARGCVRDVLGRISVDRLKAYALLFLPADAVTSLVRALEDPHVGVRQLSQLESLAGLVRAATAELERRAELPPPSAAEEKGAEKGLRQAAGAIARLGRTLAPGGELSALQLEEMLAGLAGPAAQLQSGVDTQGYLRSRDGRMNLAMVRPVDESDEPAVVTPFVEYVRRHAETLVAQIRAECARAATGERRDDRSSERQGCAGEPLRVRLAGLPALVVAEQRILDRDTLMTSAVAAISILLIFAFGFRSLRQSLIGMFPLTIAMLCVLALVRLTLGELNLITTAFIPTVLGIGIDFSVQLLARYNEARRTGAETIAAVETSIRSAGPGVLTAALTMAGAFLTLGVSPFKGFADLGLISAAGLLICLLAALVVGSAMLTWRPLAWLQRPPRLLHAPDRDPALRFTRAVFKPLGRRLLLAAGLATTLLMLWQGTRIPWSYNYLDLLPAHTSAVEAVDALAKRTDFSFEVAALQARSLAEARRYAEQLRRKPTVGRVESLASYLPPDQPAKLRELERLRAAFKDVQLEKPARASSPDRDELVEALEELIATLEDLRFTAGGAGRTSTADALKPLIAALRSLREHVLGLAPEELPRLARLESTIVGGLHELLRVLEQGSRSGSLGERELLALLPKGVRDRLYAQGHYAVYVYPRGSLWAEGFLERFVSDLRSVDPAATGFPVSHWDTNLAIERGFRMATLLAVLALVVLLWLDFRSVRYTALALFPLAFGMSWMWGSMSLLGMEYNFANIVGFPMIVGIGVAYGVYILHRHRQEQGRDVPAVVRNTGLGVLLSALANMAGFGSIALATHRGAHSLGVLLLLGCGYCLITSTLLLPALLSELARERST